MQALLLRLGTAAYLTILLGYTHCTFVALLVIAVRMCLQEEYLREEGFTEDQVQEFVSQVRLACPMRRDQLSGHPLASRAEPCCQA